MEFPVPSVPYPTLHPLNNDSCASRFQLFVYSTQLLLCAAGTVAVGCTNTEPEKGLRIPFGSLILSRIMPCQADCAEVVVVEDDDGIS